jgi:hypothetical protein
VDIFDNSVLNGTSIAMGPTGAPVVAERGPSNSGAYGKARAELGSNGFMASSGAAGFSAWSDGFTLTGGSGAGDLTISVSIHGELVGTAADMVYGLYVAKTPFSVDSEVGFNDENLGAALANANLLLSYSMTDSNASPNTTLIGKLNFTFGEKFYLFSYLGGDVCTPLEPGRIKPCSGGSEDFYHSAVFGLTAPAAAAVSTLSGHEYVAAVPEGGPVALFVVGLLTLSMSGRRTRAPGSCKG